ncbi:MAG: 50S ribosomal protein L17 [Clostridia bacterium]|jgi:large subunit ribosomal protein L17
MPSNRKLDRPTDQRIAILKNLVTGLIMTGKLETTETRGKEVKKIADSIIAKAVAECDNFTSKPHKVTRPKTHKGKKLTMTKESKAKTDYEVIERETVEEMVTVDNPSRLHARRQIFKWVNKVEGVNVVNKLFDEIAPKLKERQGGYIKIYKLGQRRGDAAEMVLLEIIK